MCVCVSVCMTGLQQPYTVTPCVSQHVPQMLRGEPGEWAEMKKKLNHLLEKLTPDSVVPVEVFDPQTLLKKSGQLEVKENGKVVPKQCFLFSRILQLLLSRSCPISCSATGLTM